MANPKPSLERVLERTLLRPTLRATELDQACREAVESGLAALVVFPAHLAYVRARLPRSVQLCAAIGYPFGVDGGPALKAAAVQAVAAGADQVEVVASIPLLVHDDIVSLRDELRLIVGACPAGTVRIVIEACYLSPAQLALAGKTAASAGSELVVCATGFGTQGATHEAVAVLRRAVPDEVLVKAQGGVRTLADVERLREAGATRVGVADSAAIIRESAERVGAA